MFDWSFWKHFMFPILYVALAANSFYFGNSMGGMVFIVLANIALLESRLSFMDQRFDFIDNRISELLKREHDKQ